MAAAWCDLVAALNADSAPFHRPYGTFHVLAKTVLTVSTTTGESSMGANNHLRPCQRVTAALAAAVACGVVIGTVMLVFDSANRPPALPPTISREGAPPSQPPTQRLGTHDRDDGDRADSRLAAR